LLVVFDDVDIPVGEVKIREKGSAGSHNGMKSIINKINSNEFARIKVGIGDRYNDLATYVLSSIKKEHADSLKNSVEKAAKLIESFIVANCIVSNMK
jgi:PTH1 family peptidyl-tRNA hydrolase